MKTARHLLYFCTIHFAVILLSGCGGYAPLHRAHEVLFDMPYVTQEHTIEDITLGAKPLSSPEIHELFCRPGQLEESYHVLYMRIRNAGKHNYFLHVLTQGLPTAQDVAPFFDPYSTLHTMGQVLLTVPAGVAIAAVAPDPLTSFVGFLGVNMAVHVGQGHLLGAAGYEKLAHCALVKDSDRGAASLTIAPYQYEHCFIFVPRSAAVSQIQCALSRQGMMTHEVTFDIGTVYGIQND